MEVGVAQLMIGFCLTILTVILTLAVAVLKLTVSDGVKATDRLCVPDVFSTVPIDGV